MYICCFNANPSFSFERRGKLCHMYVVCKKRKRNLFVQELRQVRVKEIGKGDGNKGIEKVQKCRPPMSDMHAM